MANHDPYLDAVAMQLQRLCGRKVCIETERADPAINPLNTQEKSMDTFIVDLAPLGGDEWPTSVTVRFYQDTSTSIEIEQDVFDDAHVRYYVDITIEQGRDTDDDDYAGAYSPRTVARQTFAAVGSSGWSNQDGSTYVISAALTDIVVYTLLHASDLNLDFPEALAADQFRWTKMRQELRTHTEALAQPGRRRAITNWLELGEARERVMLRDALAILDAWVTINGGESLDERLITACEAYEDNMVREAVEFWETPDPPSGHPA